MDNNHEKFENTLFLSRQCILLPCECWTTSHQLIKDVAC